MIYVYGTSARFNTFSVWVRRAPLKDNFGVDRVIVELDDNRARPAHISNRHACHRRVSLIIPPDRGLAIHNRIGIVRGRHAHLADVVVSG